MKKNNYLAVQTYNTFVIVSILSIFSMTAGILIDNVVAGRMLGTEALKAMSLVGPLIFFFSCINNLCSTGGTVKAAQAIGRGDWTEANYYFSTVILFITVISVILTVATLLIPDWAATLLGARDIYVDLCAQYLKGYMWNTLPHLLMLALNGFIKIDGSPDLPLISVVVMSISNIFLDILFVGPLHGGMFGLGLATTCGYAIGLAVSCTHFLKKEKSLRLRVPTHILERLREILGTGMPTAAVRLGTMIKSVVFNRLLVAYVGANALIAMNVSTQTDNLFGVATLGIAQALIPVVAFFYGQKDRSALRDTLRYTLWLGFIANILLCVIICVMAGPIVLFFKVTDPVIATMARNAVRLFACSLPLRGINCVFASYFQSTKKKWIATAISFAQTFLFACLFACLLVRQLSDIGVWISLILTEATTLCCLVGYIAFLSKKMPHGITDFLLFGKNFGEVERLEISLGNDEQEVINAADEAYSYGQRHGLDERRNNAIRLMVEEAGKNIVNFALRKGKRVWFDVFLSVHNGRAVLDFRDNGAPFNPITYADQADGYGLKLIRGLSESIEYHYDFGLNALHIEL